MEGTSEDPLVKDQLNDTPDFEKVISNGINGSCEVESKLEHKMEITSNNSGDDENNEYDDDNGDENRMQTLDVTKNNLDRNKMAIEEEFEAKVEGNLDVIDASNDHEIDESEEKNNKNEEEKLQEKGKQIPNNGVLNKNINAINEVKNHKQHECVNQDEPALQVDNGEEIMEVDECHDNTSDIECLDGYESSGSFNEIAVKVTSENNTVNDETSISNENQSIKNFDTMSNTPDLKICDENGSTSSPDIEEITDNKSNGHKSDDNSPKELKHKKARKQIDLSNITPRRSSRNIKRTSYIEKEPEEVVEDSSDIEEIKPEDPLAVIDGKDKENSKLKSPLKSNKTTIVVNDTKRLVEIAAGSKVSKGGGKKEPTLVIIDTNSILSGRGGVPMSSNKSHHSIASSSSFSVMPVNLTGTTTMYSNMRTTITPVPMTSKTIHQMAPKLGSSITAVPMSQPSIPTSVPSPPAPQILPTLTDDMFVVEAPSFIVPYVYEKPPVIPLKEFVTKLDDCIDERERFDRAKKREIKKNEEISDEGGNETKDSIYFDYSSESKKNDLDIDNNINSSRKTSENHTTEKSIEDKEKLDDKNKIPNYFDLPLGKFFMQIGVNLVQEFVQTDLLKTQKRKQSRTGGQASTETQIAINSLIKNLEFSKENNEPFHLVMKKCEFCNFKTESALVMQHHLETPHMKNYLYKCNFCPLEVRSPHDIRFHMEAEHNTRGRLEKGPAFHQCPNCQFEDNQKGKLTRHMLLCAKKFRPEKNLEPASDWEPPAKIPRLNRARHVGPLNTNALAIAMSAKGPQPLLPKLLPAPAAGRGRGRPPMQPRYTDMKALRGSVPVRQDNSMPGMMYRPTSSGLLVPTSYQFGSNQIFPNTTVSSKSPTAKLLSQPSISITPLPRTTSQTSIIGSGSSSKPGGKNTFVICEICDGYIKDLEQLRNHMQWIHKVKIHPKMIYNRPPLNCQKCQFRFFTDQGLERHLLGSHGLVTSSMQEAANKGKDAGRCPACGKVYQWKLLNHVARDHLMTLKPAHLSYKCTVCTATFGMYKQFENHVYSAHSAASKQSKKNSPSSPLPRSSDSLLKPLKINDEITIIPQPAKPTTRSGSSQGRSK